MSITSEHWTDIHGNPAGGVTQGVGFVISWQNGPLGRGADRREPNGAFVESLIEAAVDRFEFYQASKFHCVENAEALNALRTALHWCNMRTAAREAKGVEGTHEA